MSDGVSHQVFLKSGFHIDMTNVYCILLLYCCKRILYDILHYIILFYIFTSLIICKYFRQSYSYLFSRLIYVSISNITLEIHLHYMLYLKQEINCF